MYNICFYLVFGSCLRTDLVFPTLAGYIFYKSMEGRAESEMDRTYGEKSLSNKKSFNKEAMMTEILKGGGEANLAKVGSIKKVGFKLPGYDFQVREQTNKRRQEIADSLTTYGAKTEKAPSTDGPSSSPASSSETNSSAESAK